MLNVNVVKVANPSNMETKRPGKNVFSSSEWKATINKGWGPRVTIRDHPEPLENLVVDLNFSCRHASEQFILRSWDERGHRVFRTLANFRQPVFKAAF